MHGVTMKFIKEDVSYICLCDVPKRFQSLPLLPNQI